MGFNVGRCCIGRDAGLKILQAALQLRYLISQDWARAGEGRGGEISQQRPASARCHIARGSGAPDRPDAWCGDLW